MISGFQSREFGLGLDSRFPPDLLAEINRNRKGTKYLSISDIKLIYLDNNKKDLTHDTVLRYFRER